MEVSQLTLFQFTSLFNILIRFGMDCKNNFLIFLTIFLFSSCGGAQKHTDYEHEGHSHEQTEHTTEEVSHFTLYADSLEVYIVGSPMIRGKEVELLAHITSLENFKPVTIDSLTLMVKSHDTNFSFIASATKTTGIYKFNLSLDVNGEAEAFIQLVMNGKKRLYSLGRFTIYHCEHDWEEFHESEHIANTINFTKEQSWAVDFATQPVIQEPLGQVIRTTGRLLPAQSDEMILVAGISGTVSFVGKSILPGLRVNKSEVLLSISSKGMADDNFAFRYAEAKNRYELAKSVYMRQRELAAGQVISVAELEKAKSEFEVAYAAFMAMENGYTTDGQQIVSPANAEVTKVFVSNGEYVGAGQPLVKLSKLSMCQLQCHVQPRFRNYLSRLYDANIRVNNSSQLVNLKSLGGTIVSVGGTITTENHLLPVILELPVLDEMPLGDIIEVYLLCKPNGNSLAIPMTALLEEQGNHFVMVQLTPEKFIKREVKLGNSDGVRVEVLSGLQPGDRVVSRGAVYVKMAQSSGALDAHSGHVH